MPIARADVASFDRHVRREAPLQADLPRPRIGDLEVRIEDLNVVGYAGRHRIDGRLLTAERRDRRGAERQRRKPSRVAQQHGPTLTGRNQQTRRRVAVLRDGHAGVAVEDACERADRITVVADREPARTVACSGSPRSVRRNPEDTFGRHAAPRLGARLFQSVL